MKTKIIIPMLLISICLGSCTSKTSAAAQIPALQNDSATTASATLPNESIATAGLTDIPQLEKWNEYENALALEILQTSDAICEWEILGQDNSKVFVWAICQANSPEPGATAAASTPAVIQLGPDRRIENVQIPGDGVYIRELLPPEVQEQIAAQSPGMEEKMWAHLHSRQERPEPPLNVLSGVPLP